MWSGGRNRSAMFFQNRSRDPATSPRKMEYSVILSRSTPWQLFRRTSFQFCLFGVKRVNGTAKSSPSLEFMLSYSQLTGPGNMWNDILHVKGQIICCFAYLPHLIKRPCSNSKNAEKEHWIPIGFYSFHSCCSLIWRVPVIYFPAKPKDLYGGYVWLFGCNIKWATSCENVSYAICEQQRCRSACASAQSDQHLCCSLPR